MRAALALVSVLLLAMSGGRAGEGLSGPLAQVGIDQKIDQRVPLGLRFRDESGLERPLADYFSTRPVILVPAYYGCTMLCTQVLSGLAGSLKGMSLRPASDFQVVIVSFDPSDTPAQAADRKAAILRRYGRSGTEAGWHFLTGTEPTIRALMESIGYRYAFDPRSGQFAHAAGLAVLTPGGKIARYFFGIEFAPRDLRLGLVEASAGRLGTPIDRLLLFCFHYDPAQGRYGARILRAMHVGGVLTLIGMLSLIGALLFRERRIS